MTRQYAVDPSKGKYFTQVLNMADDELGPYQMRLLVHYTRVAWKSGKCWEGVRTTARITRMSSGMVTKTRNELENLGYIRVKHRDDDTCVIVIVDRMAENVARYANQADIEDPDDFDAPSGKRSCGEQGVHVVNTSKHEGVHVVNERRYRTNKKTLAASNEDRAITPETPSVEASENDATQEHSSQGLAAPRKRSAKQLARDEAATIAMNALAAAMGVTLAKSDEKRYSQIAQTLVSSTITYAEFDLYVKRLRAKAVLEGNWSVTIESLLKNGRPSEYVTAREAYRKSQQQGDVQGAWGSQTPQTGIAPERRRYSAADDPAYQPTGGAQ
jgi:hypothetical protein